MFLVLTVLATYLTWGVAKAALPFRLPSWVHSVLVLALAYVWTLVPLQWLTLAAVACGVAVLHHLVGDSDRDKPLPRWPRRKPTLESLRRVPPLP